MTARAAAPALAAAAARLISARTGLAFPHHRLGAVAIGLASAMRKAATGSGREYLARLAHDGPALAALVDEVTVGETFFFRDAASFDFIRRTILPDLSRRRVTAAALSAWSAGCASGEEAYSLAILFEEEGKRADILATDLSGAALAKARAGIYGAWSLRGWPGPPLATYFERIGRLHRVAERLRARIVFAPLNLAADPYPGERPDAPAMDLILCRNVLIHLDHSRIAEVARHLFAALADGGWLVTGPSDPPLMSHAPFEVMANAAGLVYRKSPRRPAMAAVAAPPPADDAAPSVLPPVLPAAPPATPSAEGEFGHALALMSGGDYVAAARAVRRALYLDRRFAVAHLVLGAILWRLGDWRGAKHAYRTGQALAAALPPEQAMPGAEGESAAAIAAAAGVQLALLERMAGAA